MNEQRPERGGKRADRVATVNANGAGVLKDRKREPSRLACLLDEEVSVVFPRSAKVVKVRGHVPTEHRTVAVRGALALHRVTPL